MEHATILRPERLGVEIEPISESRLRVGVVPYLNTKPLIFGLESLAPRLQVEVAPPSRLAQMLRGNRLDVALVPVLEYFSRPDYGLIDETAICANGRVRSVALFSRVPIEQVGSISLDPESLTSNALIKVLCSRRFAIEPRWVERNADQAPAELIEHGRCDAAVVIGNQALRMSGRLAHEYDLGQEWWHLTGLPFVFAVWAVRPGVEVGDLPEVLRNCRRLGLAHLDLIARESGRALDLDPELCLGYLRRMIRYDLTERAWSGMARFFGYCADLGLCPRHPPKQLARRVAEAAG